MPEICLWKTGRYCFVHCAGEDSSARIGEDGIKKCKRRVSPLSPEKTMEDIEEVSAGFGVAFPSMYQSGDFEEDYEDMEDDPVVFPPPLPPWYIERYRVVKWKQYSR